MIFKGRAGCAAFGLRGTMLPAWPGHRHGGLRLR